MIAAARRAVLPGEPRYLRPGGNRRVRRRRLTRSALRAAFWGAFWLGGAALAWFGCAQAWRVLADPEHFPLRRVIVEGGGASVESEVASALSPLMGRNVLTIDLAEAERAAGAHPWVRSAVVRRRLPSGLLVLVSARRPEALVLAGGTIRMVDAEGADLGAYDPSRLPAAGPVLTGAERAPGVIEASRLAAGLAAVRRLRQAEPDFLESISSLDVSRRDRLTATLRDLAAPLHLSPEDPATNVENLAAVRRRLEEADVAAAYLDLRFGGRIAVMPFRGVEGRVGA